jgi:zinc D-Ala-D-Ala carboxypeptidase
MQLSEHFSLAELTFSQTALRKGIDNTPPVIELENLRRLCWLILEPLRTLWAVPIRIDSGYRSPILNNLVGGAPTSAHMDGRAADLVPIGLDLTQAFAAIRNSQLPFDQLIIECNAWIHVAIADEGQPIRKVAMMASGSPGHWVYNYV